MWTQRQLADALADLGLRSGSAVLAHVSLPAIGPIEGGAETLVTAFREALGAEGTLLVPVFTIGAGDREEPDHSPAAEQAPSEDPEAVALVNRTVVYGKDAFAETLLRQPDAFKSEHPAFSFAAIGADAEALTAHVPFHYPLGSEGPLARLHQRNGWILLIGVGHASNVSLHLAEIWADVPYIHRSTPVETAPEVATTMLGSLDCSAGFAKIEPLLRQSRILQRGVVGDAESRLMRMQQTVSMAVTMLQGSPSALLCDDPTCRACALARRMTAKQESEPI